MKCFRALQKSRYMQYLAAIAATISMATSTIYVLWTSPSLPKLTAPNSPIGPITTEQGSWIAASYMLGQIPGGFLARFMVEKFGRKNSMLFCAAPLFLPWIVKVYAKSVTVLIVIRTIAGIAGAVVMTAAPMYTGEVAEKDIRGVLGLICTILMLVGSLFVLSVGPFVSYEALAWSCSVFPLVFFVFFYFMPESPYYLIKAGKRDEARTNLIRLSQSDIDRRVINDRLKEIEETVEYDMQNKSTLSELLFKQENRKAFIIMIGTATLQTFSGLVAIAAYMQTIIESTESSISPEVSSIIFGVIQLFSGLLAAGLVDRMGRRPLLIISSIGCALALTAEGTYFYLQDVVKADLGYLAWLPTTALVVYQIMNSIGIFPVSYVLLGELFATNVKSIAGSTYTIHGAIFGFLTLKFFDPIAEMWGMHVMFWIFAGACGLGGVFAFVMVPETKGKTFAEIQAILSKRKVKYDNSM